MLVSGYVVRRGKLPAKFNGVERKNLAEWFRAHQSEVLFMKLDAGLLLWTYDWATGWSSGSKFKYVPNRPDLWKVQPKMKPCAADVNPFRFC